ncbi:MAG: hypothetical protein JO040_06460 [Gemmatimonadetes bacterium]|nr:hypothetical protein [Gemmatimonadota bacterium]
MRKPISKHALRRAMERVQAEGFLQWSEPVGTVVDRVWHEMEKEAFNGKKPAAGRAPVRKRATVGAGAPVGVAAGPSDPAAEE